MSSWRVWLRAREVWHTGTLAECASAGNSVVLLSHAEVQVEGTYSGKAGGASSIFSPQTYTCSKLGCDRAASCGSSEKEQWVSGSRWCSSSGTSRDITRGCRRPCHEDNSGGPSGGSDSGSSMASSCPYGGASNVLELEEPPHKRVVVITEKAAAKPATVSKPPPSPENSQPRMVPSLGDSQPLAAPLPKDFLCPFPLSPGPPHLAAALCPEAALSSDTLYPRDDPAAGDFLADASPTVTSPRSSGIVVPGPLPAAPVLDSVSDPVLQVASVAVEKSIDHSPPGTAGVSCFPVREEAAQSLEEDAPPGTPPQAVSGSPTDLGWLPAEGQMDDLEAWLSSIPEELVSVPSPKPAKPVSQLEEAGGLKSGRPVGPLNAEALASRFLRSRLRSLDTSVNCLQKVRRDLQESVTEAHKRELQAKEVENGQLRRRIRYLEAQLERAKTGHTTLPTRVGDLQHLSTTRAFVLFPNVGRTAVYNLEPADVSLLEFASRSEPLSSDHL